MSPMWVILQDISSMDPAAISTRAADAKFFYCWLSVDHFFSSNQLIYRAIT